MWWWWPTWWIWIWTTWTTATSVTIQGLPCSPLPRARLGCCTPPSFPCLRQLSSAPVRKPCHFSNGLCAFVQISRGFYNEFMAVKSWETRCSQPCFFFWVPVALEKPKKFGGSQDLFSPSLRGPRVQRGNQWLRLFVSMDLTQDGEALEEKPWHSWHLRRAFFFVGAGNLETGSHNSPEIWHNYILKQQIMAYWSSKFLCCAMGKFDLFQQRRYDAWVTWNGAISPQYMAIALGKTMIHLRVFGVE